VGYNSVDNVSAEGIRYRHSVQTKKGWFVLLFSKSLTERLCCM
jgi:hypothetical protein